MTRIIAVVSILFVFGSIEGYSQRAIVTQPAEWFSTSSSIKMSSRFSLFVDGQYRFVKGMDPMQFQFRIGGDFKINSKLSIMPLGYVSIWNPKYGDQPAKYFNNEHRIFQQFQYKHNVSNFRLQHRFRIEERFLQQHHTELDGTVIDEGYVNQQIRIRYRAVFILPITKQESAQSFSLDAKTWFIQIYDEIFMSWGASVTYHEPDQNRIFVGAGYQINKDFSALAGFNYQLLVKSNGAQQENNMGIGIFLVYNFDLTK